jgi:hypothetical protein
MQNTYYSYQNVNNKNDIAGGIVKRENDIGKIFF